MVFKIKCLQIEKLLQHKLFEIHLTLIEILIPLICVHYFAISIIDELSQNGVLLSRTFLGDIHDVLTTMKIESRIDVLDNISVGLIDRGLILVKYLF